MCFFLQLQLPAYSIAQNISIQSEEIGIGYAQPWKYMKMKHPKWNTDPTVFMIVISILVLSKMIIFTLVTTYYESVKQLMKGKSSPFYYFYWGCHCITLLALLIGNVSYIAIKQENKLIVVVSTAFSAGIDIIGAFVLLGIKCRSELLPVPLTSYFELCGRNSCIKAWEHILNFAAFFFTFFFISTILQTVPNILISYYAFPSRTLIRIGFFQVSFVCLVVAFGGLIFLLEKLGWLLHIKIHKKIPNELHSAALIIQHINIQKSQAPPTAGIPPPESTLNQAGGQSRAEQSSNGQGSEPPRGSIQESSSGVLQQHSQASHSRTGEQTEPQEGFENVEYSNNAELKYLKDLFIVGLQIVTALLLAVALFFLIIVIGMIVFTDSVDKDNVQGILTLLPTIVVDAVIIVTRKRFFDSKEALKYQLARVMEDNTETPNERTPLVR